MLKVPKMILLMRELVCNEAYFSSPKERLQ